MVRPIAVVAAAIMTLRPANKRTGTVIKRSNRG